MNEETIKIIELLDLSEEDKNEMISNLEKGFSVMLEFDYNNGIICYKFD